MSEDNTLAEASAAIEAAPPLPILIVDDEAAVLRLLTRLLKPLERELITASSAEEAIEILEETDVAVLLSDQQMPGLSGAELFQIASERFPDPVRVMITGNANSATAIEAINRGEVYRFIPKPWDNTALVATIRDAAVFSDLRRTAALYEARIRTQNRELRALNQTLEERVAERTREVVEKAHKIESLYHELDQSFDATMKVLISTLRLSQIALMDHSERTVTRVEKFAKLATLDESMAHHLSRAALLHWLGLISAPSSLFTREIKDFDHDELALWEFHPTLGRQAIINVPVLQVPGEIIQHYLEPWPSLRDEEEIAEEVKTAAQVLALSSAYERRRRVPRDETDAWQLAEEGLARVEAGRETLYEPKLTDLFIQHIRRDVFGVERFDVPASLRDLKPGMVLARDVHTELGIPVATCGMVLTHELIGRLRSFDASAGLDEIYIWQD